MNIKKLKNVKLKRVAAFLLAASLTTTSVPVFAGEQETTSTPSNLPILNTDDSGAAPAPAPASHNSNSGATSNDSNSSAAPTPSNSDSNVAPDNSNSSATNKPTNNDSALHSAPATNTTINETNPKNSAENNSEDSGSNGIPDFDYVQDQRDLYNEIGRIYADALLKMLDENTSSEEASKELTFALVNSTATMLAREVPFIGGLAKELLSALTSGETSEDAIKASIDNVVNSLDTINSNMITGFKNVDDKINKTNINLKITKLQDILSNFDLCFGDAKIIAFSNYMNHTKISKDARELSSFLQDKIYSVDGQIDSNDTNQSMFSKYKSYIDTILNNNQLHTFSEFGGDCDIFDLVDIIQTEKGSVIDFGKSKEDFTNVLESKFGFANIMLHTAIDLEKSKYTTLEIAYNAKIAELSKSLLKATPTAAVEISKELDHYNYLLTNVNCKKNIAENDLNALITKTEQLSNRIADFRNKLTTDLNTILSLKHNEQIEVNYKTYGTAYVDNCLCFPNYNEAKHAIEYRDLFNKLRGYRTVATSYSPVDQDTVKVGSTYHLTEFTGHLIHYPKKERTVKILKIYNKTGKTFLGLNFFQTFTNSIVIECVDTITGELINVERSQKKVLGLDLWDDDFVFGDLAVSDIKSAAGFQQL